MSRPPVPFYGIAESGLIGYLKTYLEPTWLMLPFHLLGELTRTLALAVRLFGNIMSGTMILAILLSVAPLFFPVLMTALGLLTGLVQAYIFSILATVYIAAATRSGEERATKE
jgi:F-type H+-transporting ATPase subunit a